MGYWLLFIWLIIVFVSSAKLTLKTCSHILKALFFEKDITGIGIAAGIDVSPSVGRELIDHFKKGIIGLDPLCL